MRDIFQAECWEKHPSVGVHMVYYVYGKGYGQIIKEEKSIFDTFIYENSGN